MKKFIFFIFFISSFLLTQAQEIMITGYIDASCAQAKGRTLEIYVNGSIDFNGWSLKRQSNGNGYTYNINISELGEVSDGFAYITNSAEILTEEFDLGDAPIIETGSINDNGDDAFQIENPSGELIDRFGEDGVQPSNGDSWFHQKTYYYRNNGALSNYGNFNIDNWTFGEINLLNDEGLCNDGQAYEELVPFGTYDPFICDAVEELPFTDNFDNLIPPNISNCSSIENAGEGNNWEIAEIDQNDFNGNVLRYSASENSANAWYFTRKILLEANISYQLTFKYGNNDPSSAEKLKVAIGSSNDASEMTTLESLEAINQGEQKMARIIFDVEETDTYYFGFNAFSDANQNELYVREITLDKSDGCLFPITIESQNITASAVDLTWSEEENDQWKITYGAEGFNPEEEGEIIYVENNPEQTIENLSAGTTYDVYIQTICNDNNESDLSEKTTFTTLCEAMDLPYTQNFEEVSTPYLPECNLRENLNGGNLWETVEAPGNGFNSTTLQYTANVNNPANVWFFTRGIDLEANTDYQISYIYGNDQNETTEKLQVSLGNYPSANEMNEEIIQHSSINQGEPQIDEPTFSVEEDGIYYFGFQAFSDAGQGNLYLDEIQIKEAPSCLRPTTIEVNDLTTTSAAINWEEINTATSWEVLYGEQGFNPEIEGETLTVNGDPETTIENLNSGTTYEYYIKSYCSSTDESDWSLVKSFTTLCANDLDIPFTENFEDTTPPEMPNCTTLENAGAGNNWQLANVNQNGFTGNVLRYEATTSNADAWYFTEGINLEAHVNYQITYTYGNNTENTNFFEKLKVSLGSMPDSEDMTTIKTHPQIKGGEAETSTTIFSVEEDGVYYFGFNAYSNFNASTLFLDNIEVDYGPECPSPENLYYSDLSYDSVFFDWEPGATEIEWEIVYGYADFNPNEEEIESFTIEDTPEILLEDLESETNYHIYIRAICSEDSNSNWEGPKFFKTKIAPPENYTLCDAFPIEIDNHCAEGPYTNIGAIQEIGEFEASCQNHPSSATVWFTFEAPETGEVSINTAFNETDFNTETSVYEQPEDCENLETLGEELACSAYNAAVYIEDLTPGETYYVRVGGNGSDTGNFCLEINSEELSVKKQDFENFSFYPNPVENKLNLQAEQTINQIIIHDLNGRAILKENPKASYNQLNLESLPSGVYFMTVHIEGKEKKFKLIKS